MMNKAVFIAVTAASIAGVFLCASAFADDDYEKYQKYMEKYYKHLNEAEEERSEGDWDDHRKELEKAQENWWKAQKYYNRLYSYPSYPQEYYAPSPQYHEWRGYSYRPYYHRPYRYYGYGWGGHGGCWSNRDFFIDLDLRF
ncbi:MAG: hypothetical protein AB1696_03915 [Planctomycetota bacterium]